MEEGAGVGFSLGGRLEEAGGTLALEPAVTQMAGVSLVSAEALRGKQMGKISGDWPADEKIRLHPSSSKPPGQVVYNLRVSPTKAAAFWGAKDKGST